MSTNKSTMFLATCLVLFGCSSQSNLDKDSLEVYLYKVDDNEINHMKKTLPVQKEKDVNYEPEQSKPTRLEIRFDNFEHKWSCDWTRYCTTKYGGEVYLFNLENGDIPVWNSVESTLRHGTCNTDFDIDRNSEFYRFEQYVSRHNFAWEHKQREGRTQLVAGKTIFRSDAGTYVVTWRSSKGCVVVK